MHLSTSRRLCTRYCAKGSIFFHHTTLLKVPPTPGFRAPGQQRQQQKQGGVFLLTTLLEQDRKEKILDKESSSMGDISAEKVVSGHYHMVLGVSPDANMEQVRNAYRSKLFEVHPDYGGSAANFLEVREAFQALTAPSDLFALTRIFCDAVWASDWKKAERQWEDLRLKMVSPKMKGMKFGALFFDDVLHACRRRDDFMFLTNCVHSAEASNLFENEKARNIAYDSLLWHLSEGNRLKKQDCNIHIVYDCLHEMHNRKIPILEDGWYIAYSYES